MPTKRKAKLWGKIEEILACKTTKFGAKKYQIKLVDVETLVWVTARHLSKGAVESYNEGSNLPKNSKAQVDRGYVNIQKKNVLQV